MYQQSGNFFRMPDHSAFYKVRTGMQWGKRWMIDFLVQLGRAWDSDIYWQIDESGNYSQIPLGDISVEGGSPPRWKVPRVGGHVSHRCGVDVDIYVISKDGTPTSKSFYGSTNYDLARTKELGRLILKIGKQDLEKVLIGGDDLVSYLKTKETEYGHSNVIEHDPGAMHLNHFHIRLKNKDGDKSC
ncbi:MAG: hypothetical protein DWQ47_03695 [Acidobacteria bacterium]|nr:MAG: hypothetical protein DWQ32_07245 [Acidobacteriota bacterium]REK01501.1 MAG: hypothetical protein DWQ38_03680 [Acidobacteriota bacterium]REK14457.1 MAG: hypothetical protein DWQ43_12935 [Acidobacteriota bacterium]REK45172.1 MAG: hypothetical protein DWQ47_03695 [Acidobacteriota bacterium]